jgi:CheY-like chemotaxis protein
MSSISSTPKKTLPHGANISVIDNDPYFRDLYTVILRRAGHRVTTIPSVGQFDWNTLANIELLILDVMMLDTDERIFINSIKHKRADINVLLAASQRTHSVTELLDSLDSLADIEVQIRGIVYKPFIADQLASAVERCMDLQQILPYTRHSLELLDQAIRRDEFVVNYKPLYRIDVNDTALIHVDPYLVTSEGAMPEEDYAFIMFNSTLSTAYLEYLVNKVIIESAYIPDFKQYPFMIKVPIFSLSHPHFRDFLISSLKKSKSMGVEIVIAINDSEYFLNGDAARPLISEMHLQGFRMALHNTRHPMDSSQLAMLSIFDYAHLDPGYSSKNGTDLETIKPLMSPRNAFNISHESDSAEILQNAEELAHTPPVFVTCTISSYVNQTHKQISDLNHE